MKEKGICMVISAPSGAGKSTICRRLLAACPDMQFSVSFTSREPRPNEINGKDYHFISRENFQCRIERGEFVEWEENFGEFYGTSGKVLQDLLQSGKDLLLDIEPRGAKQIKNQLQEVVLVFVLPPSLDELLRRLQKRGHETPEAIRKRFDRAESELGEVLWYDYTVINDDLEEAVKQLTAIYRAEKCRTSRLRGRIHELYPSMKKEV